MVHSPRSKVLAQTSAGIVQPKAFKHHVSEVAERHGRRGHQDFRLWRRWTVRRMLVLAGPFGHGITRPWSVGEEVERLALRSTRREVLRMLASRPLFSGLSEKELRSVAGLGTSLPVKPGHVLTEEGAPGLEAFLIVAGTARCLVDHVEVAILGSGDFFGEMSLLDGSPRSATVVADSEMTVTAFDRREFFRLIESSPKIAAKLLAAMAARIRTLDQEFAATHG
jgi:CRP/FNR family transcriptional regulator, cyclic AMP receptor protein